MIVLPFPCAALGGHSGVSHNDLSINRNTEVHPAGGPGALVDAEFAAGVVGDPGGVSAACFGGDGQSGQETVLLFDSQAATMIHDPKKTAHISAPPRLPQAR